MDEIVWTQQEKRLWTGRRDGKPVGTIERGRRFVFVDVDGDYLRSFRTLSAAQAAAEAHCGESLLAAVQPGSASRHDRGRPSLRHRVGF